MLLVKVENNFSTFQAFFVHYFQVSRIVWGKLSLLIWVFLLLICIFLLLICIFLVASKYLEKFCLQFLTKKTTARAEIWTRADWTTSSYLIHYTTLEWWKVSASSPFINYLGFKQTFFRGFIGCINVPKD